MTRNIIWTEDASRKQTKFRSRKTISKDSIEYHILNWDQFYPDFVGITAIPFFFNKTKYYIKINARVDDIILITISGSKDFEEYIRHL